MRFVEIEVICKGICSFYQSKDIVSIDNAERFLIKTVFRGRGVLLEEALAVSYVKVPKDLIFNQNNGI